MVSSEKWLSRVCGEKAKETYVDGEATECGAVLSGQDRSSGRGENHELEKIIIKKINKNSKKSLNKTSRRTSPRRSSTKIKTTTAARTTTLI